MNDVRKRKHEVAQAAKLAASVNFKTRRQINTTSEVAEPCQESQVDWLFWCKLPEVKVFEALALLRNIEPESEPPDSDDYSPEYRKTFRMLFACLSDRSTFTPSTLNMDPALHGVRLVEVAAWALAHDYKLPDKFPRPVELSDAPEPPAATPALVSEFRDTKPWLLIDPRDPTPAHEWYTPARYFARQLVIRDSTLLTKRLLLADKVSKSLTSVGIYKHGGKKPFVAETILKAFTNIRFS